MPRNYCNPQVNEIQSSILNGKKKKKTSQQQEPISIGSRR